MKAGDQVITGPFNNVRTMNDGDPVEGSAAPKNIVNKYLTQRASP